MTKTFVLVLTAALCRVAAAQPTPVDNGGTMDVSPNPPPPPPPPPHSNPPPPPPPPPAMERAEPMEHERPIGLSFAIGVGYLFPDSLETPNTVSVRLRLPTGLTFEPLLVVQNESDNAQTMPAPSTTDSTSTFSLGTLVRFPVIQHGRVDFEALGSIGFSVVKHDPDGADNTNTQDSFEIGWGIGLGYWISHHWQLSFSATNPLIDYTSTSMETGPATTMTTSSTKIGLVFDPVVMLMIHLYN